MEKDPALSIDSLTKKFPAAAEYLIEIFVINRDYGMVKNSVIARRLGVSKPAVTQAMNRLRKYGLIEQDLYGSINFTPFGRVIASRLLKRHYLLEHLLISKLDYDWIKADIEASRLQSSISADFTKFLFDTLGRPDTCPHGNPFPDSERESEIINAPRLSAAAQGERLILVRITEEGETAPGLLEFCYKYGLKPGNGIEILLIKESSIMVRLKDGSVLEIPSVFAQYICSSLE